MSDKLLLDSYHSEGNFSDGTAYLAFILHSDPSMSIFRRFDWLTTYCLFETQSRLINYEDELRLLLMTPEYARDESHFTTHDRLLERTKSELKEYSEMAKIKYDFLSYETPEENSFRSLLWLFYPNPPKLRTVDSSWLFKRDDMIALDPRPKYTKLGKLLDFLLAISPMVIFNRLAFFVSNSRQIIVTIETWTD
jgi:hypothetical protein